MCRANSHIGDDVVSFLGDTVPVTPEARRVGREDGAFSFQYVTAWPIKSIVYVVTYDELLELHYITPIENVPSMLEHGILSHRRADVVEHASVAMQDVQDRRAKKKVPGGRSLHEYVNLYFHARNPMMYKRRSRHAELCVLSVHREVVNAMEGVAITDRNASSDYVRFARGVDGLDIVDKERVFARYWTHENPLEQWRRKSIKCAEVLVPDRIDTTFVRGVYVSCSESAQAVYDVAPEFPIKISPSLFFQQ